jgi:tetratricopeptide (TPR) repeat protein
MRKRVTATTGRASVMVWLVFLLGGAHTAAAEPILWERIAEPQRARVDGLVQKARELLVEAPPAAGDKGGGARPPDNLGRSEALLREALALAPLDFSVLFMLAEVQSLRGHIVDAAATLERAEPLARLPSQRSSCWFRLGIERSRLGRYRDAVASYDQQIALGESDATVYANVAELLMALGRLREAEERYRDAIRIDERAGDRRGREQSLAFSYYGLGVALDRDQQEGAAREAIGRAVAMDPNTSLLRMAQQPGADVFFIPDGDVYYYLGLAGESLGNRDDAGAAFQEYVARQAKSPWVARARVHLAALAPSASASPSRVGAGPAGSAAAAAAPRWRVVAVATVMAQGPIVAPMIDAALKHRPLLLEACFAPYPPARGHEPVRFSVDVELDANGAVARATARLPPPFADNAAGPCVEAALRTRLILTRPAHGRSTTARIEVLLATADGAGL